MTTSGSYAYSPSLGEITIYAFGLIGLRPASLLQEHMFSARTAANLMQASWANKGVNLWCVDLVSVALVQGQATYNVDPSTIAVLDAYMEITNGGSPIDRIIMPVSRSEYANYPNKTQQGFTTTFWFDRLIAPTITLWPVPDGSSAQYLKYYRMRQIQDANMANGTQPEFPLRYLEAVADGLAYRLARTWAPQRVMETKAIADESYQTAALGDIENAQQYITPMISNYYRP